MASKNTQNKIEKKFILSTRNQKPKHKEHSIKWNLTLADAPMLNLL